eukprot:10065718-Karenia_brevis.AAC.1
MLHLQSRYSQADVKLIDAVHGAPEHKIRCAIFEMQQGPSHLWISVPDLWQKLGSETRDQGPGTLSLIHI